MPSNDVHSEEEVDEEFNNDEFIADWNSFLHKEGLL